MKNYYNIVETLVSIVCVDDGKFKILLKKKQTQPYKGYWILPGSILQNNETLEKSAEDIIYNCIGIRKINNKQYYIFSNLNRSLEERILAVLFVAFTTKELSQKYITGSEYSWFDLKELPKLGYDHNDILKVFSKKITDEILRGDIIYNLFPSDFTISEIHKFYENISGKSLDKRNFRKRLFNKDLIEETGFKNKSINGRPSNLYRFKEMKENVK